MSAPPPSLFRRTRLRVTDLIREGYRREIEHSLTVAQGSGVWHAGVENAITLIAGTLLLLTLGVAALPDETPFWDAGVFNAKLMSLADWFGWTSVVASLSPVQIGVLGFGVGTLSVLLISATYALFCIDTSSVMMARRVLPMLRRSQFLPEYAEKFERRSLRLRYLLARPSFLERLQARTEIGWRGCVLWFPEVVWGRSIPDKHSHVHTGLRRLAIFGPSTWMDEPMILAIAVVGWLCYTAVGMVVGSQWASWGLPVHPSLGPMAAGTLFATLAGLGWNVLMYNRIRYIDWSIFNSHPEMFIKARGNLRAVAISRNIGKSITVIFAAIILFAAYQLTSRTTPDPAFRLLPYLDACLGLGLCGLHAWLMNNLESRVARWNERWLRARMPRSIEDAAARHPRDAGWHTDRQAFEQAGPTLHLLPASLATRIIRAQADFSRQAAEWIARPGLVLNLLDGCPPMKSRQPGEPQPLTAWFVVGQQGLVHLAAGSLLERLGWLHASKSDAKQGLSFLSEIVVGGKQAAFQIRDLARAAEHGRFIESTIGLKFAEHRPGACLHCRIFIMQLEPIHGSVGFLAIAVPVG